MSAGGAAAEGLALDLDWVGFERVVAMLADEIGAGGVPDVLVGVLRGGMMPAVMLAHRLGVRTVRGVDIARTLSEAIQAPKLPAPDVRAVAGIGALTGMDVVLVDDVAGSGLTIEAATAAVRERGPSRLRRVVAVVNTVNWKAHMPRAVPGEIFDHVGASCSGWVRLPWEYR